MMPSVSHITTNMKSRSAFVAALIFLIQFWFLPLSHSYADLIVHTCKHTPDHHLCVSSLVADPRSAAADVAGLALIMVDVVKAKAAECADRIDYLLMRTPEDQALKNCKKIYSVDLTADLTVAVEALSKGNMKFAEQSMDDVAMFEAMLCEDGFSGSSPMTDLNSDAQRLGAVAAAIVRLLL